MRYSFLILLVLGLYSCNERIVQLPETHNQEITEVLDISPVYLFYIEATDSVAFNRKNVISTTNWLVNVDKRLSLKQAMPHIIYLQEKRKKAGMHKNEAARNYFSCSNPDIQNLAFIDFTGIEYVRSEALKSDLDSLSIQVLFEGRDAIRILTDGTDMANIDLSTFLDSLQNVSTSNQKITLCFNEHLSFQDYISFKSEILKFDLDTTSISKKEIIYN